MDHALLRAVLAYPPLPIKSDARTNQSIVVERLHCGYAIFSTDREDTWRDEHQGVVNVHDIWLLPLQDGGHVIAAIVRVDDGLKEAGAPYSFCAFNFEIGAGIRNHPVPHTLEQLPLLLEYNIFSAG